MFYGYLQSKTRYPFLHLSRAIYSWNSLNLCLNDTFLTLQNTVSGTDVKDSKEVKTEYGMMKDFQDLILAAQAIGNFFLVLKVKICMQNFQRFSCLLFNNQAWKLLWIWLWIIRALAIRGSSSLYCWRRRLKIITSGVGERIRWIQLLEPINHQIIG